jgi:hypothetical protein
MHEFNQSLKYDKRMYDADIRGSIAYSKALTLVGILTKDEEFKIVNGLEAVKKEWDDGVVSPGLDGETRVGVTVELIRSRPVPGSARRRGHSHREREAVDGAYRSSWREAPHWKVTKRSGCNRHAALAHERSTRNRDSVKGPYPSDSEQGG